MLRLAAPLETTGCSAAWRYTTGTAAYTHLQVAVVTVVPLVSMLKEETRCDGLRNESRCLSKACMQLPVHWPSCLTY